MTKILHLVTHSGSFHADDVCATAVLARLYPEAEIVRTRDNGQIERLAPNAITYDVGRVHDREARRFDHHMRDAAKRDDGATYSSFGLIWKHYGKAYLYARGVPSEDIPSIHAKFDEQIVLPIDKLDNGHLAPADIGETRALSLSALINDFNAPFDRNDEHYSMRCFEDAVYAVKDLFSARLDALEAEARADRILEVEIQEQWGKPILELPYSMDFQAKLDEMKARHVLFVIQPSSSGGFGLTCARESAGTYNNLMDLPASWGGLSGQDLVDETGVEGVTFCHSGLFFAAGDSRECLRELAQMVLPEDPAPGL
ncbi:MYG1 family protein [Epibacterium sp. DP7N7-1]|nr:MYG1 family protein [Epibacterium sp. DP7N7-1]